MPNEEETNFPEEKPENFDDEIQVTANKAKRDIQISTSKNRS